MESQVDPKERGRGEEPRRGTGKLTARDRDVIGALALTRYLTGEQLHQAFFRGCKPDASRKRLSALAGSGDGSRKGFAPPFLRRVPFRASDGAYTSAWALTDLGYAVAERVLGVERRPPAKDVGAAFMEHAVVLSGLFAALIAVHASRGGAVAALPFRWHPTESVRLPWHEYDPVARTNRARLIVPDAVLELPAQASRVFVECEMGTHSIVAASDEKAGATLAKVERYEEFLAGSAEASRRTFYEVAYPDGWRTEVWFLVRSATRRDSVEAALKRWREERASAPAVTALAVTLEDATRSLGVALFQGSSPAAIGTSPQTPAVAATPATLAVSTGDLELLKGFYQAAVKELAASPRGLSEELRHAARSAKAVLARLHPDASAAGAR